MKPMLAVAAIGAILAGCASEPNVYYTLTVPVKHASVPAAPNPAPGPYTLAPVTVPAQVDDNLLVVRRNHDELMKLAHDRWSAPLGKQIGNALSVQLTQLLGAAPLSRAQTADQSARVTTVTVDVQRFDMVPAQFALLAATWQVNPPASSKVPQRLTCYTEVSQSVAPGVAPLVQAQQQNIELLAQAISQAWHTGQVGAQTRCQ